MKIICLLLSSFIVLSCNNDQQQATTGPQKKTTPPAVDEAAVAGSATVTITKDGKTVISYTSTIPNAVRMAEKSGTSSLMIYLNSPDNQFSLMATLATDHTGKYPLTDDGKGDAQIEVYSDGKSMLPRVVPDKGDIGITVNNKSCSGRFTGSKKGVDGKAYTISGEFVNTPITDNTSPGTK